jgi:hypothetical protein
MGHMIDPFSLRLRGRALIAVWKPQFLNLYSVNADGTGNVTRLTDSNESQVAFWWHPSGKFFAFGTIRGATGSDLSSGQPGFSPKNELRFIDERQRSRREDTTVEAP